MLITRVLTELMPQVRGRPPLVGSAGQLGGSAEGGLGGFLADCRHYAERVRADVWAKIGHLYPEPPGGGTVVAWLWARTVTCPNPACRAVAPLVSSFWLSKRKGAETWIQPVGGSPGGSVTFEVHTGLGGPPPPSKIRGGTFRCLTCAEGIPKTHVRIEGVAGHMSTQLLAVAVDTTDGRRYRSPARAGDRPQIDRPEDAPDLPLVGKAANDVVPFGMTNYADIFTNRQLVALGAFADTVAEVSAWVRSDGGEEAYATAVASVLGLCVGKLASSSSTQVRWRQRAVESKAEPAFGRHALPMVWDFAETNPFGSSVGNWITTLGSAVTGLRVLPMSRPCSQTFQADARSAADRIESPLLIATDPPYFAQIGYADLSDYFYVWLRRALSGVHRDLFATVATPKADELIAAPYRHEGSKDAAIKYFVDGYTQAFHRLAAASAPDLPMLIVYAHRQEESDKGGIVSTGWDAMLSAILTAGLRIVGTWPIDAIGSSRQIGLGANALASYIVLVCRPQMAGARVVDRQGFLAALRAALPNAIRKLQEGAISSIDLGQATIGPGMEVFSRFARVIEPSGQAMTVRSALELIGQVQGEVLDEFVGDLDPWTRWAMGWYRDHGFEDGPFGDAETLFKTTNTSLDGLIHAGIVVSRAPRVRLLRRDELPVDWAPETDPRVTVWEVTQHLTQRLTQAGGERAAADLLRQCRRWAGDARDLAQWLSLSAVNRGRPADALDYDRLVTSWPELVRLAAVPTSADQGVQTSLIASEP